MTGVQTCALPILKEILSYGIKLLYESVGQVIFSEIINNLNQIFLLNFEENYIIFYNLNFFLKYIEPNNLLMEIICDHLLLINTLQCKKNIKDSLSYYYLSTFLNYLSNDLFPKNPYEFINNC